MDVPDALERAATLALRGRGEVEPNPCVGAVLLRDGAVVGEGWHGAWGEAHAEVAALASAGARARGATLCVTLEPCSTQGKTPPCTEALLAAGVTAVVAGAEDPNPAHRGAGLRLLAAAGLDVRCLRHGTCEALAARFDRGRRTGRPHVFLKWAQSADGAVAAPDGSPVHLTGGLADARVQHWRAHVDAILVGVQTVVTDDPRLTVRDRRPPRRLPRRVVLDPSLRLPLSSRVVASAGELPTWVLTRDDADQQPQAALESEGVSVLRVPGGSRWLEEGLALLRRQGVERLLVEGGPRTHASFLAAALADQLAVFLCAARLGATALPALPGRDLSRGGAEGLIQVLGALGLGETRSERLGSDLLVRGGFRGG